MIHPQDWSVVRRQEDRILPPLSKLITTHDKLRLAELADVAPNTGRPNLSRSTSPSTPLDYRLGDFNPDTEVQQCRLPSFSEIFSDLIAAHDGFTANRHYNHCLQLPPTRRSSPGSEHSGYASYSSGIGPSPLSTAHTSPAVSPTTPHYSLPSPTWMDIQVDMRGHQDEFPRLDLCPKRQFTLVRPRRTSSRTAPYSLDSHHDQRQRACSGTPVRSSTSSTPPSYQQRAAAGGERDRHFNQKYKNPDKLFIIYHKDDLKWGWRAIQERRLELLPVLLGTDYDRSVEERRKVAGLNGMYYRQNDLNMPVLTSDGSGLVFVERDGRWWECSRSQKCRTGEDNISSPIAAASIGNAAGNHPVRKAADGAAIAGGVADTRPRGMVERYPEEVLLYWENHVRHFVPEEKAAEVYARAKRYSDIRAEQRRQHGVPQWSLDNKEDRVLDMSGPKKSDDASSASSTSSLLPKSRAVRRTKRS